MKTNRRRPRAVAAVAVGVAAAALALAPALSASASTYQDLYNKDCGAQYVLIQDYSSGSQTHHLRNHALTAMWNGNATVKYHASWPLAYHSVNSSSVETIGSSANVQSASISCRNA